MTSSQRPKVGVAALIHDGAGNIIMGERAGSHGAGTLQCPGGHLEYTETFSQTATREVLEETGLAIHDVRFLTATNDFFPSEAKHYVTIFVTCRIVGGEGVPRAMEPDKCAAWEWVAWRRMWAWAREQVREEEELARAEEQGDGKVTARAGTTGRKKLFLPLVNLCREYPELEDALDAR